MLTTDSIYNLRVPCRDGGPFRILVMRKWPRGVSRARIDLWVPDAGPSEDLLARYRSQEISWEQFANAYRAEMKQATSGRAVLYSHDEENDFPKVDITFKGLSPVEYIRGFVDDEGEESGVVLLCWEREGNCHRHVLQQLIEEQA